MSPAIGGFDDMLDQWALCHAQVLDQHSRCLGISTVSSDKIDAIVNEAVAEKLIEYFGCDAGELAAAEASGSGACDLGGAAPATAMLEAKTGRVKTLIGQSSEKFENLKEDSQNANDRLDSFQTAYDQAIVHISKAYNRYKATALIMLQIDRDYNKWIGGLLSEDKISKLNLAQTRLDETAIASAKELTASIEETAAQVEGFIKYQEDKGGAITRLCGFYACSMRDMNPFQKLSICPGGNTNLACDEVLVKEVCSAAGIDVDAVTCGRGMVKSTGI